VPRGSVAAAMTTTDAPSGVLLTRLELADLLRISVSTVDRLRVRGVLRPVQLVPNGRVGYRVEDVEALLDAPPQPHPARPSELEWH
jgi:Helix-turn-helix domain